MRGIPEIVFCTILVFVYWDPINIRSMKDLRQPSASTTSHELPEPPQPVIKPGNAHTSLKFPHSLDPYGGHRQREREKDREREREIYIYIYVYTEREKKERGRHRDKDRERDRQRERERDRETGRRALKLAVHMGTDSGQRVRVPELYILPSCPGVRVAGPKPCHFRLRCCSTSARRWRLRVVFRRF